MNSSLKYARDDSSMNRQLEEANKYKSIAYKIGDNYGIWPSIIAGIGSRESRWGIALKPPGPDGTGDFAPRKFPSEYRDSAMPPDGLGFGRGLMQIDYDYHEFARSGFWRDPENNIAYCAGLLDQFRSAIRRKTDLTDVALLRAAIASYNAGPGRALRAIRRNLDIDFSTTGGDYSADVLSRAEFFQLHCWE